MTYLKGRVGAVMVELLALVAWLAFAFAIAGVIVSMVPHR